MSGPTAGTTRGAGGAGDRVVFRPKLLLTFSLVVCVLFAAACLYGWYALGELRADFTFLQVATLVIFALWVVGLIMAMSLSVVVVEGDTLTVRNGVIRRRYDMADVRAVVYRDNDPWAYLVLNRTDAQGEHVRRQMLALQRVDGPRSRADTARLRELIRSRRTA